MYFKANKVNNKVPNNLKINHKFNKVNKARKKAN